MLTKCITILAVCAQIYASSCSDCAAPVVVAPEVKPVTVTVAAAQTTTVNRNLIGKKKYPVALKNCGPAPDQKIPVITSRFTAPAQEKPFVYLPAKIPAPKVVSHTCTCYKTIVRPRVHQQLITVPVLHRYIETLHKPVVENIHYEGLPVNCASESLSGKLQFVEVADNAAVKTPVAQPAVEVPRAPVVEVSCAPVVGVPRAPVVEVPRAPVVEAPATPVVEFPRAPVVEAPATPVVEFPRAPVVEFSRAPVVEAPSCPFRF